MNYRFLIGSLLIFLLSTCLQAKTPRFVDNPDKLPKIDCGASGILQYRSITENITNKPDRSIISDFDSSNIDFFDANPNANVLLEVCLSSNFDKARLMRITQTSYFGGGLDVYALDNSNGMDKASGILDLMFFNQTNLNISIFYKDTVSIGGLDGIYIKGFNYKDQEFTISGSVNNNNGVITPNASSFLLGSLGEKNPWVNRKCPVGEFFSNIIFSLGTAKFSVDHCRFQGGGETEGYRILEMTVSDSNSLINENYRGKEIVLKDDALEEALNYRWNHHNGCDSFYLKVSETKAQYAATAPPLAGCGTTVDHAPTRKFSETNRNTLYFVTYEGRDKIKGELYGHYFIPSYEFMLERLIRPITIPLIDNSIGLSEMATLISLEVEKKEVEINPHKGIDCGPDKEYIEYYLQKENGMKLPASVGSHSHYQFPDNQSNIRLDICFDYNDLTSEVKRITHQMQVFGGLLYNLYQFDDKLTESKLVKYAGPIQIVKIPTSKMKIVGDLTTVLQGEIDNFSISVDFRHAYCKKCEFTIDVKEIDKKKYVVAGDRNKSSNLLIGHFKKGNPFPVINKKCRPGYKYRKNYYLLDTAKIILETCNTYSGSPFAGYTREYYYIGMELQDSSNKLNTKDQKTIKIVGEKRLKSVFSYVVTHHNFGDWFYIQLPFVKYIVNIRTGVGVRYKDVFASLTLEAARPMPPKTEIEKILDKMEMFHFKASYYDEDWGNEQKIFYYKP